MKKLMVVGLVAACACVVEAGILDKLAAACTGKKAAAEVTAVQTTKTELDIESVDLMSLTKEQFDQVLVESGKSKKMRWNLLTKLRIAVEDWNTKNAFQKNVKKATLAIIDGLRQADKWIANHVRDAWTAIKEFFGGKKK